MKKNILGVAVILALSQSIISSESNAAGFKPAPPAGQLGAILVNPYGNSPLTAILELSSKKPTNVTVTVHGKGNNGVDISYPVDRKSVV